MSETARFGMTLIPLFAMPFVLGSSLAGKVPLASRWWFGLLVSGIFLLIGHALNFRASLIFTLLGLIETGYLAYLVNILRKKMTALPKFPSHDLLTLGLPVLFLMLLMLANYLFVFTHPLHPMHQDAVRIWYAKAKGLFYWTPFAVLPIPNFPMVNYPHLGAVLEMLLMRFAGEPLEQYGRLLFPTVYFFWAFGLSSLLPSQAKPVTLWVLPLVSLAFFNQTAFTNGYQDGFLAVTAGMATIHLAKIFLNWDSGEENSPNLNRNYFLALFFAGACCFIKTEGSIFAMILFTASSITFLILKPKWFLKQMPVFLPYWGLFLLMFIAWPMLLWFNRIDPTKMQDAYTLKDMLTWYRNLDRWPAIRVYVEEYFRQNWQVLVASLVLSVAALKQVPKLKAPLLFLWLIVLEHHFFIPIPFFATRLPLGWHLGTAFFRLMSQNFFAFAAIITIAASYLIEKVCGPAPSVTPARDLQTSPSVGAMSQTLTKPSTKTQDSWSFILWIVMVLLPLSWLWPRFLHPTFGIIDDSSDLVILTHMKEHFADWWHQSGFHGEADRGRMMPVHWLMRLVFYLVPAGYNPFRWILIHYLNFAFAISATFWAVKRMDGTKLASVLACLLIIFNHNTIVNYNRLGTQEVMQVLWLSLLLLLAQCLKDARNSKSKTIIWSTIAVLCFLFYFTKETGVVLFPVSAVMALGSLWIKRNRREWLTFFILNAVFFTFQRFLSPPAAGYASHFQPSLPLIGRNLKAYFFELQWHYLVLGLFCSYMFRIYRNRHNLHALSTEYWQFFLLILGSAFFAIYLSWTEHVDRYMLVASYLFALFSAMELQTIFSMPRLIKFFFGGAAAILAYASSAAMPTAIRDVYAHANERNPVESIQWLSHSAEKGARVLVLEMEKELLYSTLQYLQFWGRHDITVYTMTPFAKEFRAAGFNIVSIDKISEDVLDTTDYIFWNRRGIDRAPLDQFHQQILLQLTQSKYQPLLQNVYSEIVDRNNGYPEGTEIWKLKHKKASL